MLPAVDFDDKLLFNACKVCNIRSDAVLPSKFRTIHAATAQMSPEHLLGISHALSERSCIVDCQSPLILTFSPIWGRRDFVILAVLKTKTTCRSSLKTIK
jgi:hypothetical protein